MYGVFPRLVQTVAQLRVALEWEIDSEGVGNSEHVLTQAPEVLAAKQALMGALVAMKEKGATLEATRHLAISVDLQMVDRCLKYVSMVSKFIHTRCTGWHERKDRLPGGMGDMHTWNHDDLHDDGVRARLTEFVISEETVGMYQDYKVLKKEIALAKRIFDCFSSVECCIDQCCSEILPKWEVDADTFVDCVVVSQAMFAACEHSDSKRLERLRRAQSVTEQLPMPFGALLQKEISRLVAGEIGDAKTG